MRHSVSSSWLARGVVTAATAGLIVAGAAPAMADEQQGPKNVIVLIGDGMGYNHIDNTSLYENGTANWQVRSTSAGQVENVPGTPSQVFETWDHAAMTHYAHGGSYDPEQAWSDFDYVKENPTDSAAAGTAMATGQKTYNGTLGLDTEGNAPENLTERAIALGKAAGVVSSVPFSHATPASYVAHVESRNDYHGIAEQMIESDLDVILGAGHPHYSDSNEELDAPRYGYISERDHNRLVDGQTDWAYVEEKADFEALATGETPEKVFGLAQVGSTLQQGRDVATVSGEDYLDPDAVADETRPYQTELNEGVPSLETMTQVALNVLDEDEDGFFVMIEGGAIDWTGHANDTVRNIEETQDFNASVEAAVAWVEENSSWDETQIIVTADHETGYLSGVDSDPSLDELEGARGATPVVGWFSGDHTNQLVPVFSRGAGTRELLARATKEDPVRGAYLDNTDLANYLLDGLWAIPATAEGDIPVTAEIPGAGGDGGGAHPEEPGNPGEPGNPAEPGALVLSVEEGTAELANARNASDRLRLSGLLPAVSVTDSRPSGSAAERGWAVTGQSSDLRTSNVEDAATLRAGHLGWAPFVAAGDARPGAEVPTVLSGGPGLAAPATLGSASDDARVGTAELAADLTLEAPVDVKAGSYDGGITVSLFPQD